MWGFFILGNVLYLYYMSEDFDYNKLRLDVIQKMVDQRGIICKNKKDDMIKYLIMDDHDKYIRDTTYDKDKKGFIIGIDIKNQKEILQVSKLIEKKEGKSINRYCDNRVYYWINQKLI